MFGPEVNNRCPHCGRFLTLPAALRPDQGRLRTPRSAPGSRYDADGFRPLTPTFQFGRRPSTIVFAVAVLVIVGGLLLARVAARFGSERPRRSRGLVAAEAVAVYRAALGQFHRDCSRYPTAEEGLIVLVLEPEIPGWDGPYVNIVRADPWGIPYGYAVSNGAPVVFSAGPDRRQGTADDITAHD